MYIEQLVFLNLTLLKKQGYLEYEQHGGLSWTDGSAITVKSDPSNGYISVSYCYDGKNFDYKIYLTKQYIELTDSYRHYLLCPFSGKKATMLYMCYGKFMHISEVQKLGVRYYNQMQSQKNRQIDGHHRNKKKVAAFKAKEKMKRFHKGKFTKRFKRIQRIEIKSFYQMQHFLANCSFIKKYIR